MRIKKIRIKNIRSYSEEEIIFPKGSLLLSGDIGSGKTSILLAIEYALFGLQPGQKGSALLRNDSEFGEVALDLEVSGKEITIERRLKRTSRGINNEYSAITVNGEKFESSTTEIKTKILNFLCYPSEFIKKNNLLYRYTVYTPQEQMKYIIFEDAEIRLNIIRHIFGIDKYRRIRDNLIIAINRFKENSKILQGEIKTLEEDKKQLVAVQNIIQSLSSLIREREMYVEKLKNIRKSMEVEVLELEGKRKEKENLLSEIEKTKILITSKKENLFSIRKEISEIEHNLSEFKEKFDKEKFARLIRDFNAKKLNIENLNSQYIEVKGSINSISQQINESLAKKERIFQIDICPTCLQDVPDAHKHNILNEAEKTLSNLKRKILSLEESKKKLETLIVKEKVEMEKISETKLSLEILKSKETYIEDDKKRLGEVIKKKDSLDRDINLLTSHIENLKKETTSLSKFENIFKHKQEELKEAFRNERSAEILLAESKKELELTLKERDRLNNTISRKEESKKRLSGFLELIDWLSNRFVNLIDFTERNVMIKLRREFSKLFSKWFSILVSDSSFEVQLDEKFTPIIMQHEAEMDYAFLSGGERTAVALAYRLALNQTINTIFSQIKTGDLVILDEPTEGFSETQLDKMRDVLSELKINQLILVSHEQKMESFVDNVLRLKKSGDISHLEDKSLSDSYG